MTSTEPIGLSGGLLLCSSEHTTVHQIVNNFGFEVEFETPDSGGKCWGIFVYIRPIFQVRQDQWSYLQDNKANWGDKWFLGGDLSDIKKPNEK